MQTARVKTEIALCRICIPLSGISRPIAERGVRQSPVPACEEGTTDPVAMRYNARHGEAAN